MHRAQDNSLNFKLYGTWCIEHGHRGSPGVLCRDIRQIVGNNRLEERPGRHQTVVVPLSTRGTLCFGGAMTTTIVVVNPYLRKLERYDIGDWRLRNSKRYRLTSGYAKKSRRQLRRARPKNPSLPMSSA